MERIRFRYRSSNLGILEELLGQWHGHGLAQLAGIERVNWIGICQGQDKSNNRYA